MLTPTAQVYGIAHPHLSSVLDYRRVLVWLREMFALLTGLLATTSPRSLLAAIFEGLSRVVWTVGMFFQSLVMPQARRLPQDDD